MIITNDDVLSAARKLLMTHRWREADAVAVRWLQRQPRSGEAVAVRGLVSLANGQLDVAQDFLQTAVSLAADSGFAYLALAQCYLSENKKNEAEACLRRALALAPAESEASCVLAGLLADRGDAAGAEALLRSALAQVSDSAPVHFALAQLVLLSGDLAQATGLVATGVALEPELANGWALKSQYATLQGEWSEARQCCEQALLLDPENPIFLAELARISFLAAEQADTVPSARARLLAEAESAARQAIVLAPKDAAAPMYLGAVLRALGRLEEALAVQAGLARLLPQDFLPVLEIALTQLGAGNTKAALFAVERALTLAPQSPQAHLIQSKILLLDGDLSAGFAALDRFQRLVGGAPELLERPLSKSLVQGQHILLHAPSATQALLFARYVPALAQMGARVSIAAELDVHFLLRSVLGVHELCGLDVDLLAFSCVEPVARLPFLFETAAGSVPWSGPYCSSDAVDLGHLKGMFEALPAWRIGLNLGAFPDAVLATGLAQVFRSLGVTVVVLAPLGQLESVFEGVVLEDADNANNTQLAALVQALDCVVTVDSLLVHIAGALGQSCHLLLAVQHDAMWGAAGDLTPWYPQTLLYRESRVTGWDEAVAAFKSRLCFAE